MQELRCAFLTMGSSDGWQIDAHLAIPFLNALHWSVEQRPWRQAGTDWNQYDAVYIGTPWDYPSDPELLLQTLQAIDASSSTLVNDIQLVRWNIDKSYLRELERNGAAIVPSIWCEGFKAEILQTAFDAFGAEQIIIKPTISTNATNTFSIQRDEADDYRAELADVFANSPFVVQPFIKAIQTEGEYSLFYFGGQLSHTILKTPAPGDFRVQEEFGAFLNLVEPEPDLIAAGDRVINLLEPEPVYARCDFVRATDGRFLAMEIELIEPSMYLRMQSGAPERFARAFDRYVRRD